MQIRFALIATVFSAALVCAAPASAEISKKPNAQKAIAFLDMVFNQKKVKEGFDKYVGDKYIQHNPIAADGKDAAVEVLSKFMQMVPTWSYTFKHAYVDGDIAIVHSLVKAKAEDRGNAVIDIFPLREGQGGRALGRDSGHPGKIG